MKTRKQNMQGISLIVLVITIIVMIILATAVVLTLSNSGIISKANDAVDATDLASMQDLATMLWADKYIELKEDGVIDTEDLEDLKDAVKNGLEKADKNYASKYNVNVTLAGVTVTKAGENNWVVATVDEVPIPKGFVASQVPGEDKKDKGLVIYEGTDAVTSANVDKARETRNQFVWVPVDSENFETVFKRQQYFDGDVLSDTLGDYEKFWEVAPNSDLTTSFENPDRWNYDACVDEEWGTEAQCEAWYPEYIEASKITTDQTMQEVKAMYASVKKYGGFYIARYEAGTSNIRTYEDAYDENDNLKLTLEDEVYSRMNKYPYNWISWNVSGTMNDDEDGVVEVARSMYEKTNTNYGVVSTLAYGVQWDAVLKWWLDTNAVESVTDSTAYGNYSDHDIASYTELNEGAEYSEDDGGTYEDVVSGYTKGTETTNVSHLYTTGALKAANRNNIYDMAGNLWEWTMEGRSANYRVLRGGYYDDYGDDGPVSRRNFDNPIFAYDIYGFRLSLYIK